MAIFSHLVVLMTNGVNKLDQADKLFIVMASSQSTLADYERHSEAEGIPR